MFSQKLLNKYQKYMLRKYNVEISDSQAQLNLDSLSNLYLAFTKPDSESVRK
jgi:hypothetical protein